MYLSNDALHPPCHGGGCGEPLDHLGSGGILLTWTENGSPVWRFQQVKGTPMTVGGHQARIQIQHPGICRVIGGDESISVVVEMPAVPDNWWGVRACVRGPNVATAEAQVRAMLATAQLPSD